MGHGTRKGRQINVQLCKIKTQNCIKINSIRCSSWIAGNETMRISLQEIAFISLCWFAICFSRSDTFNFVPPLPQHLFLAVPLYLSIYLSIYLSMYVRMYHYLCSTSVSLSYSYSFLPSLSPTIHNFLFSFDVSSSVSLPMHTTSTSLSHVRVYSL